MAAARETVLDSARDEYRRLLYVAMTRAIDRLIVCGIDNVRKAAGRVLVRTDARRARTALREREGGLRRRRGAGAIARRRTRPQAANARTKRRRPAVDMPPWLTRIAGTAHDRPATIKPSGFVDDPVAAEPVARDKARERAIARGLAVHRLMQSLPDVPQERRAETASDVSRAPEKIRRRREPQHRAAGAGRSRRHALCRAVRPRQPRRGVDRRPPARASGRRPGGPAGGDARRGADRRLQVEPAAAARASTRRWKSTAATSSSSRSTGTC